MKKISFYKVYLHNVSLARNYNPIFLCIDSIQDMVCQLFNTGLHKLTTCDHSLTMRQVSTQLSGKLTPQIK